MLYPAEPKAHNCETGTCLSYVSISGCRSFSFPPRPFSQKSLRIAIFTGNQSSPAPTGQRPKTFDPNSRTWMIIPQHASPVEPAPESRLRVPFELQSPQHRIAQHSTAQRNVTQYSTITATATAFFATQRPTPPPPPRHALLLASCAFQAISTTNAVADDLIPS